MKPLPTHTIIKGGLTKRIHINQHNIRWNGKPPGEKPKPVMTIKTYKANTLGMSVKINGPSEVIYSPDKPLNCGAKVWIETKAQVIVKWER